MIKTSSTYDKAVKIVNENPNLVDDFGGASDEIIKHAQMVLGLEFPQGYKHFLSQYGALAFGSTEIYGVFQKDFEKSDVPDTVWATLKERDLINMPKHLVILYNSGMGEMYCLNYQKLNENNDPKVISYFPGFPKDAQENEVIFNSFEDFFLDMVIEEIEER